MDPHASSKRSTPWLRSGVKLGLLATVAIAMPACFFPDFTFNDSAGGGTTTSTAGGGTGGTGGTGGGHTTTSTTGGGGDTTSSTTGGGGTGGTTTTTTGGGGTGGVTGGGGTGGTTTTTTGGGGAGGMTTTSTTTTMPPLEDCQNGMDDDGDTLIDCKDTADCADYACVNSIPNGWAGYFQLYEGTVAGDPGCSVGFPMDAYSGNFNLNAPAANCSDCLCGNAQGQVCDPPDLINVLDAPCGSSPTQILPLTMPFGWSGCTSPVNVNGGYYYPAGLLVCGPDSLQPCAVAVSADVPTVTGGSCVSSGGGGMVPPAVWDGFAHACNGAITTGKGCNLGQTCLPKPKAPNTAAICIKRSGDFNCPAGQFNTKHVFYDDFTDSRACSACSCDAPSGGTCAGNLTVYADTFNNSCTSPDATFAAGACANLSGNPAVGPAKFTQTMAPAGGTCSPIGGQPVGIATKTFPQTFCCASTP